MLFVGCWRRWIDPRQGCGADPSPARPPLWCFPSLHRSINCMERWGRAGAFHPARPKVGAPSLKTPAPPPNSRFSLLCFRLRPPPLLSKRAAAPHKQREGVTRTPQSSGASPAQPPDRTVTQNFCRRPLPTDWMDFTPKTHRLPCLPLSVVPGSAHQPQQLHTHTRRPAAAVGARSKRRGL